MPAASYLGSASCTFSGVHHLDDKTGRCLICKTQILKVAGAPVAMETVQEKRAATNRPLLPLRP